MGKTLTKENAESPVVCFHRILSSAQQPYRSDRAAGGLLPTRAFRYCEPICTASAFGWYVHPPLDFSLMWDGSDILCTFDIKNYGEWFNLNSVQAPDSYKDFNASCPEFVANHVPPVVAAIEEPGIVNVWSGLFARTKENWSLLIRPPANIPRSMGYECYEGIVETDQWFGPLFTNLRLTKTDVPIDFRKDKPLVQVQPIHRENYRDSLLNNYDFVDDVSKLEDKDWLDYHRAVIAPGNGVDRERGIYAKASRRRCSR